ncbi:type II toxin-antitoxin system RelE/ParE family toxin [Bifidobacterium subtile]|uniref:RelE/StbE family addiction module toxin n=1 Tax=Bifidobacterium subtile TaxID=77635 RepID=A0A087E9W5_9BIFI|nr:type II toxin-antitoxin system RelE/ParE family toxin [Bifidobacterium subtile]KFJ04566.1 RelE/StbE family addiction module toxin [Bifidobacterium subtile]QOL35675.1 type II toxin-antitoxin system RelE/ParE family toxin [Bifidobacterium subtile]
MYDVVVLPTALADMSDAVRYIATELGEPGAAGRLADDFMAVADSSGEYPYSHRVYAPLRPLAHEYCRVAVGNYLMFYRVDEPSRTVTVAAVMYARRDIARHPEGER